MKKLFSIPASQAIENNPHHHYQQKRQVAATTLYLVLTEIKIIAHNGASCGKELNLNGEQMHSRVGMLHFCAENLARSRLQMCGKSPVGELFLNMNELYCV
jgi:hypothetical protein